MVLKRATEEDIQPVAAMVSEYHALEEINSTPASRELAIKTLLAQPDFGGIWLIYHETVLAGYIVVCRSISLEFGGFDGFIDEFFLVENFRGQGLGKQVLLSLEDIATALELKAVHLEVHRDNSNASALYENLGFKRRDKFNLMTKVLN